MYTLVFLFCLLLSLLSLYTSEWLLEFGFGILDHDWGKIWLGFWLRSRVALNALRYFLVCWKLAIVVHLGMMHVAHMFIMLPLRGKTKDRCWTALVVASEGSFVLINMTISLLGCSKAIVE